MYGNLPDLDLCNGEHVVWHTLGLGTEVDIHGIYFQGNTFQRDGMNRDTLSIFPHTTVTVSMTPDNNGKSQRFLYQGCVGVTMLIHYVQVMEVVIGFDTSLVMLIMISVLCQILNQRFLFPRMF